MDEVCDLISSWLKNNKKNTVNFEYPENIDLVPPVDKKGEMMKYSLLILFVFVIFRFLFDFNLRKN